MTRRQAVLLACACVCVVLAALAALLARDVGSWRASLRSGDVEAAGSATPSWTASTILPFGLARRLLAVDDDLAFRRGVALFRRAHTGIPSFDRGLEGTALRVQAEAALAHEIRTDRDRRRASAASNMLGVLALVDSSSAEGATPIERSVFEFQDAIHLQPGNEQAKANLELVYQLTGLPNSPYGTDRRPGGSHSGASATYPGHGY